MPHVSELHATPDHDRHDTLLVAALAAGDLTATDRDHALDLTHSCASCAELHDDLVAIARATAVVPPPVAARPRDFQLTPADAARLRQGGVRGFLADLAGLRSAATRPLGVGLATLGLVGLLVGNVSLGIGGGSSATPAGAGAGGAEVMTDSTSKGAASSAPEYLTTGGGSGAAASDAAGAPGGIGPAEGPSAAASSGTAVAAPVASDPGRTSSDGTGQTGAASTPPRDLGSESLSDGRQSTRGGSGFPSLNLVFALAVVAGLALLVLSRIRSRAGR